VQACWSEACALVVNLSSGRRGNKAKLLTALGTRALVQALLAGLADEAGAGAGAEAGPVGAEKHRAAAAAAAIAELAKVWGGDFEGVHEGGRGMVMRLLLLMMMIMMVMKRLAACSGRSRGRAGVVPAVAGAVAGPHRLRTRQARGRSRPQGAP
jgi:hypothetical protein